MRRFRIASTPASTRHWLRFQCHKETFGGLCMKGDRIFEQASRLFALSLVLIVVLISLLLFKESLPAIRKFGWQFPFRSVWDPVAEDFGAWPFIYGTIVSSLVALLIAVPLSLGIAIFQRNRNEQG